MQRIEAFIQARQDDVAAIGPLSALPMCSALLRFSSLYRSHFAIPIHIMVTASTSAVSVSALDVRSADHFPLQFPAPHANHSVNRGRKSRIRDPNVTQFNSVVASFDDRL